MSSHTPLAATVFDRVADAWLGRASDLAAVADTGYSFEEWANWEALIACRRELTWRSSPRPAYRTLGIAGSRELGCLLVADGHQRVLVEVGTVHDGTYAKWSAKLLADAAKVERLSGTGVTGLQVILRLTSERRGTRQDAWLGHVPAWTSLSLRPRRAEPKPGRTLEVRGWVIGA